VVGVEVLLDQEVLVEQAAAVRVVIAIPLEQQEPKIPAVAVVAMEIKVMELIPQAVLVVLELLLLLI
jgi:hypothetical protein